MHKSISVADSELGLIPILLVLLGAASYFYARVRARSRLK